GSRVDALADRPGQSRAELASRARAAIHESLRDKLRKRRFICVATRRLAPYLAIPFESEALERGQDSIGGARARARLVDVLDAQQPLSARSACIGVARHRGDERSEVERTGGRGGEAAAIARLILH